MCGSFKQRREAEGVYVFRDCFVAGVKGEEQQMTPAVGSFELSERWNIQAGGNVGASSTLWRHQPAPGNASHSSSWQSLGHFQQSGEKTL